MYLSMIIVLLAHVILSTPAESNSLNGPHQAQFLRAAFPEVLRGFSGIISNGPIFTQSINNGIQITRHGNGQDKQVFESNCTETAPGMRPSPESKDKEGLQQPQGSTSSSQEGGNHGGDIQNGFPLPPGSAALFGLSSKEIFGSQATGLNLGTEKENEEKEQIFHVKLPNRPKTIPRGNESEVISFVISEPSKTSGKTSQDCTGNIAIIPSDDAHFQQGDPSLASSPKPENLIKEVDASFQPKDFTVVSQRQTSTTERTISGANSSPMSVVNPTTKIQSSTQVARNLRLTTFTIPKEQQESQQSHPI